MTDELRQEFEAKNDAQLQGTVKGSAIVSRDSAIIPSVRLQYADRCLSAIEVALSRILTSLDCSDHEKAFEQVNELLGAVKND